MATTVRDMIAAINRNPVTQLEPMSKKGSEPIPVTGDVPARQFPRHEASSATVRAAPESVFAFLDAHENIAEHMNRPNWAMLGGTMTTSLDNKGGKEIGSVMIVEGKVLGIPISLKEVVIQRVPLRCKRWETMGTPRLIVVGSYRMGFEIEPVATGCRITASIDYDFPRTRLGKLLGSLVGPSYARWCVNRIVEAVVRHFARTEAAHAI